jgi:hypothetical protein
MELQSLMDTQNASVILLTELQFEWVAFFSDCVHEVLPVKSGNRVTVTYAIVLKSNEFHFEKAPDPLIQTALSTIC